MHVGSIGLCFMLALACCGRSFGNAHFKACQYAGSECNLPLTVHKLQLQSLAVDCQSDKACVVDKCLANLPQLCTTALQRSNAAQNRFDINHTALLEFLLKCIDAMGILCCNTVATVA